MDDRCLDEQLPLDTIPSHPLGIKPSGNALTASCNLRSALGNLAILPDEMVLLLLEFLDCTALLHFGATCKASYAFSRFEDLWKALFIE